VSKAPVRRVLVVSGPSGVGKSTLIRDLLASDPELRLSVSSTTRDPRQGEQDGRDYHFIDRATFERMIEANEFLEWARVYDNYYGTSRKNVERILAEGHHAVLDIDTQGAMRIKGMSRGAVFIFITPPSLQALERRLRDRRSETDRSFAKRMAQAEHEMSFRDQYDYIVANDEIDLALKELRGIVEQEKARAIPFVCPI
jgi:guanylate kinase